MSFRNLEELAGAYEAAIRDLESRIRALETRRVRLGAYYIEQDGSGNLVAKHASTGHVTIIATPA